MLFFFPVGFELVEKSGETRVIALGLKRLLSILCLVFINIMPSEA